MKKKHKRKSSDSLPKNCADFNLSQCNSHTSQKRSIRSFFFLLLSSSLFYFIFRCVKKRLIFLSFGVFPLSIRRLFHGIKYTKKYISTGQRRKKNGKLVAKQTAATKQERSVGKVLEISQKIGYISMMVSIAFIVFRICRYIN